MSFSIEVKDELSTQISGGRHCKIAEIAAIISMCGRVQISVDDKYMLKIHTENTAVARKYYALIKTTFNIVPEVSVRQNTYYTVFLKKHEDVVNIFKATKLLNQYGEIGENMSLKDNIVIMNECCKRAFIRGAFLATGSISDPEKFYHCEIVCSTPEKSTQLCKIIQNFGIDAKVVERKRHYVVYIKDGSGIVDLLNVMEAHVALMNFENVRIMKEMRNSVNRKVNCETANLNKTVSAAVKQIEDIKYIRDTVGLSYLPENLENMAIVRLANPEASLKELGDLLTPAVGKSGVNHRLRKICEIAEDLRDNKEDSYGN